jgi:hypothetical protein
MTEQSRSPRHPKHSVEPRASVIGTQRTVKGMCSSVVPLGSDGIAVVRYTGKDDCTGSEWSHPPCAMARQRQRRLRLSRCVAWQWCRMGRIRHGPNDANAVEFHRSDWRRIRHRRSVSHEVGLPPHAEAAAVVWLDSGAFDGRTLQHAAPATSAGGGRPGRRYLAASARP